MRGRSFSFPSRRPGTRLAARGNQVHPTLSPTWPSLVALILLAGHAMGAGWGAVDLEERDPDLLRAVQSIRRSFVEHRAGPILALVPGNSKVFLAVKEIAAEGSYYSRDQVQVLLRNTLRSHRTVRFMVKLDRMAPSGGSTKMTLFPATWIFEHKGMEKKIKMRFVLSRHESTWTLREIHETR